MYEFDMKAFHRAVDERRRERGLSWIELAAEVNRPFEHTSSIPIHLATIRNMAKKRSVTSAVVLQVFRWLQATPESFLSEPGRHPRQEEELPRGAPDRILRFDTRALHAALDQERKRRGMTWQQVARELPGFTQTMLKNLASGPLIGFPRVMWITQWLGSPAARFVRPRSR
ncbi:MAG: hypothetical protein WA708_19920 [Acidobacteriaceae bacterium]